MSSLVYDDYIKILTDGTITNGDIGIVTLKGGFFEGINDDVDLNINREFEIDIKETDVLIDQAQPSNHKPPSILQLLFHLSGKKELCLMFII